MGVLRNLGVHHSGLWPAHDPYGNAHGATGKEVAEANLREMGGEQEYWYVCAFLAFLLLIFGAIPYLTQYHWATAIDWPYIVFNGPVRELTPVACVARVFGMWVLISNYSKFVLSTINLRIT